MAAEDGPGRGVASQVESENLAELYVQAAEVQADFRRTVCALGSTLGVKVKVPSELKRISR